ncbi:methyltransferase involved in chemotaxis (CheR domain) [Legionella busanensis]|uniref:Methyltransferase involved in chemotaxis (CheR domain) n=1 Tax=Legionella busanensis TaxID=190655 RepID=A0A378JFJ2_9GAMM|nr:protein-glutamate O-methyltransferase CheR [Legionella busanensis]STX49955.1 methyltransferase involved in chemotaxis (CheR domain) [Legionella busanensis]
MNPFLLKLEKWANKHYGLYIHSHALEPIQHKLKELLNKRNLNERTFFEQLNTGHSELIKITIDILTVPESYFFRDSVLFAYLKNHYLPNLILKKRLNHHLNINIWSAGCARGEEIYSIAILLVELLPDLKQWTLNLLGTDINKNILDEAKKAIYTKRSLRSTEAKLESTYFTNHHNNYTLVSSIRDLVQFKHHNLADPQKMIRQFDLIICRNVFIYLTPEVINRALDYFYDNLIKDGLLFLGHAEYPHQNSSKFTINLENGVCFLKKEPENKKVSLPATIQEDKREFKLSRQSLLATIESHLEKKNYTQALEEINCYLKNWPKTSSLLRYKGECLLQQNELPAAHLCLIESLKLDSLNPVSFFFKGLIELELRDIIAAMTSLKNALYIKNNFPEAAYYLGLVYLQQGNKNQGAKWLRKALQFANKLNEGSILYTVDTRENFINAIHSSISYYER